MNKTVELIKEWVEFEEQHPKGSLEDFCKNFLSAKEKKQSIGKALAGSSECLFIYSLTKVINRLSKLWMYFTLDAMKPMGLTSFDEFVFLYTVHHLKSIRKKDLIYMHFIEISSGLLVIDRLINKGFLEERTDEQDKRSKQVSLTKKGNATLKVCDVALSKVAESLYGEMPEEELKLCVEYLSPLENSIAQKWNKIKRFKPVFE
ncbi:MAG: winged helix DNA-binding protein [Ferruginibacter sp.]